MSQSANFYEVLGLPRYASIDEVRATFRRLAVQYHPDKNPGDRQAEEHFKQIANAYSVLGDEEAKREYDLRLSGMYIYQREHKTAAETQAERRKQAQEKLAERKRRQQEREAREIREVYEKAKRIMPYRWRYLISALLAVSALLLIVDNWFLYDVYDERETSFAKMFAGYVISLATVLFFLNSLFKKWNAENLVKPFRFDIRSRIVTYFIAWLGFIFIFSFTAPAAFKEYQLETFGKSTEGFVTADNGPGLVLVYYTDKGNIIKTLDIAKPHYGFQIPVRVTYSEKRPYISRMEYIIQEQ